MESLDLVALGHAWLEHPEGGVALTAAELAKEGVLAVRTERVPVRKPIAREAVTSDQQDRGHVGAGGFRNMRIASLAQCFARSWRGALACRMIRGPFFP